MAVLTGLLREGFINEGADVERLIDAHSTAAYVLSGVCAAVLALRLAVRNRLSGAWKGIYLALLLAAVALVFFVGHRGGQIVYGIDFFKP